MNKQQLVAKTLDRINEVIHNHNQKPEVEKFGITVTEQKKIVGIVQSALSECWDMAKIKGAEELFVKLDEEYESFKISEAVGSVLTKYRNSILYEKNTNTDIK